MNQELQRDTHMVECAIDLAHDDAIRVCRNLSRPGSHLVPITIMCVVRTDQEGRAHITMNTARLPAGAPPETIAEILNRTAEGLIAAGGQDFAATVGEDGTFTEIDRDELVNGGGRKHDA